MTAKIFINKVSNSRKDFIEEFFGLLKRKKIKFCVIGGLAVNVYAEPVVSLDVDVAVVSEKIDDLTELLKKKFKVKTFEHSVNIAADYSDVRIQIQTDKRYQEYIKAARVKRVLGYGVPVAKIEDVLKGKIWVYGDKTRRPSKRQKDLADIMRLLEAEPSLISLLPESLQRKIKKL